MSNKEQKECLEFIDELIERGASTVSYASENLVIKATFKEQAPKIDPTDLEAKIESKVRMQIEREQQDQYSHADGD